MASIGSCCAHRVLGPPEVHTDAGDLVEIAGARPRTVLIRLALAPGRVVTTVQLVDAVWADEPPSAAVNALQALVSRPTSPASRRSG